MRRTTLILALLAGFFLAFAVCGGFKLASKVSAAMNAPAVNVMDTIR